MPRTPPHEGIQSASRKDAWASSFPHNGAAALLQAPPGWQSSLLYGIFQFINKPWTAFKETLCSFVRPQTYQNKRTVTKQELVHVYKLRALFIVGWVSKKGDISDIIFLIVTSCSWNFLSIRPSCLLVCCRVTGPHHTAPAPNGWPRNFWTTLCQTHNVPFFSLGDPTRAMCPRQQSFSDAQTLPTRYGEGSFMGPFALVNSATLLMCSLNNVQHLWIFCLNFSFSFYCPP